MNRLTERYKIARLIARKVSGTISEEEADELDAWVELSARHREEVTRIEGRLREDIRQGCKLNMTGEWNMFQQKFSRKRSIRWWRYSAAIVVVGVCAIFGVLQLQETKTPVQIARSVENNVKEYKAKLILDDGSSVDITDTTRHVVIACEGTSIMASESGLRYELGDSLPVSAPVKYNTLVVPRGGEYELLLADGTRVWMNSESKLVYPVQFPGERREVEMEGEVCFLVAKNERQPFIVKTKGVSVEVLGTFFNVEAYPGESSNHNDIGGGTCKRVGWATPLYHVSESASGCGRWMSSSFVMSMRQKWCVGSRECVISRRPRWRTLWINWHDGMM